MLIIGREIVIFCVSHPVEPVLLSVPTGYLVRVSVIIPPMAFKVVVSNFVR
jgi:hypothetical protein